MRADRLLSLLLLLHGQGRRTAGELAAELEVSVRTVYRDIEALGAAGVPVVAERGPDGGYRLLDGYRTRLTGLTTLTAPEAAALSLVGAPGPAEELGLGALRAQAELKLRTALSAGPAAQLRLVQDRFHLDTDGWFQEGDPVPHLAPLAQAVWEQQGARVRYTRVQGKVERVLEPLGLVLKAGVWYVVARSGEAAGGTVRTYRVSRFRQVALTGTPFTRPPGFSLPDWWRASSRDLDSRRQLRLARMRLSPRGQRLLPAYFGAAGTRALAEAEPSGREGWLAVTLPVEARSGAVDDVLRLGPDAEVLDPPELRAAVAESVARLARQYAVVPDDA